MLWLLFLGAYITLFSVSALLDRTIMATPGADERAQTLGDSLVRGGAAVLIAIVLGSLHPLPGQIVGYFLISVVLDAGATVSYFKALKTVDASTMSVVFSTMFMWITLISVLFLHEHLTTLKVLGTVAVFAGVLIALWRRKLAISRGIFFAFLAPFLWGSAVTLSYYILRQYNAPALEAYEDIAIVLLMVVLQPVAIKKMDFYRSRRNALILIIDGILAAGASIANFYAYQYGRHAAILAPLASTRMVFVVLLSAMFLGERDFVARKLAGTIVALIGVILLLA